MLCDLLCVYVILVKCHSPKQERVKNVPRHKKKQHPKYLFFTRGIIEFIHPIKIQIVRLGWFYDLQLELDIKNIFKSNSIVFFNQQ